MSARIIFFDTETTGNTESDRLCQLAVKERGKDTPILSELYKPPVPMSVESMAVHHITDEAVADKPFFMASPEYALVQELFNDGDTVAVAHNAAFDLGMLGRENVTVRNPVCTYKVARALDPEETIGTYQLQYLRYYLKLDVSDAPAHSAWGDVLVLEALFERLLAKMIEREGDERLAIEAMLRISAQPLLFTTLRFGKYKGRTIKDVAREDPGYLTWLLAEKKKAPEGEGDWIYTLEKALERR